MKVEVFEGYSKDVEREINEFLDTWEILEENIFQVLQTKVKGGIIVSIFYKERND